ncbi:MAG: hypothetical protein ACAI25_12210, partial [Planctomycetota bacterium]
MSAQCRECKADLGASAFRCPKCGHPIHEKDRHTMLSVDEDEGAATPRTFLDASADTSPALKGPEPAKKPPAAAQPTATAQPGSSAKVGLILAAVGVLGVVAVGGALAFTFLRG